MTTTMASTALCAPAALLVLAAAFAACDPGPGSEIGPREPELPAASSKVVVLDDQGRGVAGAVALAGAARAVTGRNGRGDFEAETRGARIVRVDAAAAAATDGDRLASYSVALDVVGQDLPQVLHVPDLAVGAVVPTGAQAATTTVATTSGDELVVPLGAVVGHDAAANVDLRLGVLQAAHLPGALPTPASASEAFVWTRGVFVAPVGVAIAPAAELSTPDDAGFAGGAAAPRLFRLDDVTGAWTEVAVVANVASGRVTAAGVAQGGLYAFAAAAPAGVVRGRVVDASGTATEPAAPVPDVLVRVDHAVTTTDAQGFFRLDGVAVQTPAAGARSAVVEAFAGGAWLPARLATSESVQPGDNDLGEFVLDTRTAGNVLLQQIRRGRAEGLLPAQMSALLGGVAVATTSAADGVARVEDLPDGYVGFDEARVGGTRGVVLTQSVRRLDAGRRWYALAQFAGDRNWNLDGRSTQILAVDARGGGPLQGVDVMQGATAGAGRLDETRESGTLSANRDVAGRATGVADTSRAGARVVHAFAIVGPSSDRLELPLQVARPAAVGAFDRFGLVAGAIGEADPARDHAIRATRRIAAQEWWDDVVDGVAVSSTPVDVDPADVFDRFVVGLPAIGGNLAVAEFAGASGVAPRTLARLGLAAEVEPVEGARIVRDIALEHVADATFRVADAFVGAPAALDPEAMTVALALRQQSERVVDCARGLQGNHARDGDDLVFTLPPLAGALAGQAWLALLQGEFAGAAGVTHGTTALVTLPGGACRFRGFPTITAPAPAANVQAAGFTARFALPSGALHGWLELRSVGGAGAGETLLWQAALPPDATEFAFVALPSGVTSPLRAGVTYELTVAAMIAEGTSTPPRGHFDAFAYLRSIGAVERGVTQVVRTTVQVTAQ